MSNPLPIGGKEHILRVIRSNKIIHGAILLVVIGVTIRVSATEPTFYAHAYSGSAAAEINVESPMFQRQRSALFKQKKDQVIRTKKASIRIAEVLSSASPAKIISQSGQGNLSSKENDSRANNDLSDKIYEIVGESPIKEMVPFIAKRDVRVAAFLVGIAKKESNFGAASPSKDGRDCYNYWGYKGQGGRGSVLGYSCFASAQEAVETVGTRIQKLVEQNHTTPAKMVVWKCGTSCDWDQPANVQSWISGVSQFFNKIVGNVG